MRTTSVLLLCSAAALACGDDGSTSASGGSTSITSASVPATEPTTTPPPTSGATDSGTGTDTQADTTPPTDSAVAGSSGDTGFKFDMPVQPDVGTGDCECGNADWSYVFIANTGESTISKINTRTMIEEGRYATGGVSPSRTSVSIDGKAVVVANRGTGLAKYWSKPEFCDPMANGQPGLQTSMDGAALPFGDDDCLAWFAEFPDMTVQRPVQWTPGDGPCHDNQKIWTTTGAGGISPILCGPQGVWVHRLDGATGVVEDTIHLPEDEFNCDHTNTNQGIGLGPYGGAVDALGNFWFHGWGNNKLVRVDAATLTYEIFPGGGYGITVDTKGRVWLSSNFSRFDYTTKEKVSANASTSGGITQDLQGRMWAAGQNGVVFVDMETLAIGQNIALPVQNQVKGVSVDIDGFIWAIAQGDPRAFKIDPNTFTFEIFDGLNDPYTYSDMTGGAVFNITCNPAPL